MSRSPVKIHVTPNLVAPAPALTSSVDYKSELFLVFLPLFPSINKLVLQPRSVEFNFFINCDRQKRFWQNERRRADLQKVPQIF